MFLRHAFAFLVPAILTTFLHAADPAPPHTWQRWEHALTSTGAYANPYADVTLRVRFSGPAGRAIAGYGFGMAARHFASAALFPRRARGAGKRNAPTPPIAASTRSAAPSRSSPIGPTIRSTGTGFFA